MANHLYQYSILSALMHGVCREGTTVANLLTHGDHGLGTMSGLNGEIIIVNKEVYHFLPNGQLRKVESTDIIPFAMITRFEPTLAKHPQSLNMSTISNALSPLLPACQNSFLSIRVDAMFTRVTFRVIPAQSKARESLSELAKRQELHHATHSRGTLVGFWSPGFTSGFSVAGFHLHFLSEDRAQGGHVMEFEAEDAVLQAAAINAYNVELPASGEFQNEPIGEVLAKDLHAAEGQ
ncbi:alpha-acetolactate decarboxylase [Penicillium longicatenatum]|nr:alpha-acetolactate decarboxylase [Penicillium longicatenatum]